MFAGQISRATVLTASATGAGVGIKNLFPGEFFQFADTKGFRIFKIANRFNITGRSGAIGGNGSPGW